MSEHLLSKNEILNDVCSSKNIVTTKQLTDSINEIKHFSAYSDCKTLEDGIFCESVGEMREAPTALPMNGITLKITRAQVYNKNIIGVITSVNPLKFTASGIIKIKVINGSYNIGDLLIATIDGYGKKATPGEIYDSIFSKIPIAKIIALDNVTHTVNAILL